MEELYKPWNVEKLRVNTRTAEMIKYANNSLLATQISAINEIANLAAKLGGIDIMDVVAGVHLDNRWNPILPGGGRANPKILTYLVPGCGFGGSCFPKDVQALRSYGEQQGVPMRLLGAVLDINEAQPQQVTDILQREPGGVAGRKVLVLGLAFKPGTDDVRESASLKIVTQLAAEGAQIVGHDPIALENFRKALGGTNRGISFTTAWRDETRSADIIIVATSWPEYQALRDMDLTGKILFDARRAFSPTTFRGVTYLSIGRRMIT